MKKTFKVIMLHTSSETGIFQCSNTRNLFTTRQTVSDICQHLYIVSDDEAKEGDWVIGGGKHVAKVAFNDTKDPKRWIVVNQGNAVLREACKKIVATTESPLLYPRRVRADVRVETLLPQLPDSFIQAYIKAYNEDKTITEVDLEVFYNDHIRRKHLGEVGVGQDPEHVVAAVPKKYIGLHIKTRPDNTVIVHRSKLYSASEVRTIATGYAAFIAGKTPPYSAEETNNWFNENL